MINMGETVSSVSTEETGVDKIEIDNNTSKIVNL